MGVGPPALDYVGQLFDRNKWVTAASAFKVTGWALVWAFLLGIDPRNVGETSRFTWAHYVLLTVSLGWVDEGWHFTMLMCEAVSMDAVCRVVEAVQGEPQQSGGDDRRWLVITDMHKELDRELRDLWEMAARLYALFFFVIGAVFLTNMLATLCVVKFMIDDLKNADVLKLVMLGGAVF